MGKVSVAVTVQVFRIQTGNRMKLHRVIIFLAAFLLVPRAIFAADVPASRPNIIFILADDMGWNDLHCYGHPYAKTPNIDKLAAEGTRFGQCYATGVTCCPSRTGFMTSRFPASFAKYPANGGFADRVTITELLHKQGYATGHFGKWHIGPNEKSGTYGIDTVSADDGGGKKKTPAVRGRDAHFYDEAIKFIEAHKGGPFYVNIWDHIPHHPVNPSQAVVDAFGPLQVDESKFSPEMQTKFAMCKKLGGDVSVHMRAWLAEIKAMDDEVGMLMKRLDELGLSENTIIAFSSDQGPADIRDPAEKVKVKDNKKDKTPVGDGNNTTDIRLNAMGYAGSFRGGKHNQYEGGVRIPFIVRWPGHIQAGRFDEKSVISGADWLPTLCAITGTKIIANDYDGEDASAAWLGKKELTRTKPLMWKTSSPNSEGAIRDGNWKLHHPNSKRGEPELYDVAADPGERNNLAIKKPEIVKQLSTKLEAWQATLPKEYDKTSDGDK